MVPCILLMAAVIHQATCLTESITTDSNTPTVEDHEATDISCDAPCPKFISEDLVCGSDGNSYLNICEFEKAKCRNGTLIIRNKGKCQTDVLLNLRKGLKYLKAVIKSEMQMAANKSHESGSQGSGDNGSGNKKIRGDSDTNPAETVNVYTPNGNKNNGKIFPETNTISKSNENVNEINLNENESNLPTLVETSIVLNSNENGISGNKNKYGIVTISIPAQPMPIENINNELFLAEPITVSNTDENIRYKPSLSQTNNVTNPTENGTRGNKSSNIITTIPNPAPTNLNGNKNNEPTPIVTGPGNKINPNDSRINGTALAETGHEMKPNQSKINNPTPSVRGYYA